MNQVFAKYKVRLAKATGIRLRALQDLSWDLRLLCVRFLGRVDPFRRKRKRQLGTLSEINLHFGSGPRIFPGWINIDAFPYPGLDIELDLRFPLPLAEGSCRFIFAEHILEHFDVDDGGRICQEFFRLLKPGGVVRIIVPDAEKFWQAYIARDLEWFKTVDCEGETPLEGVNKIYYLQGHHWMYDFEVLSSILKKAGFLNVVRSTHLASQYPDLRLERDEPFRRESSLYVEATKT